MGWSCYKHEWDIGSPGWDAHMEELCARRVKTHNDWGIDDVICPKCYEDLARQHKELYLILGELVNAVNIQDEMDITDAISCAEFILEEYKEEDQYEIRK